MRICKLHANVQSYIINSWGFPVILLWSCNHSALIWDQQGRKTQGPHWYAADVGFSIISDHKEQSEGRLRFDEKSFARLPAQTLALKAMTSFTSAAHWDWFQVLLYIYIYILLSHKPKKYKKYHRNHWIWQNSKWVDMTAGIICV